MFAKVQVVFNHKGILFRLMPIYEYFCPKTNRIYSFFARSAKLGDRVPCCPDLTEVEGHMVKLVSGFSVTGRGRKDDGEGIDGSDPLDDPRMESALAEMERETGGMDEENPDPRQMGRLMRKMAEISGERLPASMEEMIGRLEAGEDPEKLEDEFGDLLDEEMPESGEGTDKQDEGRSVRRVLSKRATPTRDPELYELEDYL